MDRTSAIALVKAQIQWTVYPTLSEAEVDALVDATVGFTVWAMATAYIYGAVVQPTVRNGHLYRCIVAGTSGADEPTWPLYTAPDALIGLTRPSWHGFTGLYPGSMVGDGTALTWIEAGPDTAGQYDARKATYAGWLQKAAKASGSYDVKMDGQDELSRSQIIANCTAMARIYKPTRIA